MPDLPVLALALVAATACGSRSTAVEHATQAAASFELRKHELVRRGASSDLIAKLVQSRFRYFRMLAEPFEVRTCDAFQQANRSLPVTAVHGDAHVEQFVVTAKTFGLEDFDHSGFGPAVVDLVRYAASLHVACSDVAWPCNGDAAVATFLDAYRASLATQPSAGELAVVQRLRAKAPASRARWLAWVDTRMIPLEPGVERSIRLRWAAFADESLELHPERPRSTYDVIRVGSLSMGVGSALEHKVLLRVAGPSSEPADDLVIEARDTAVPHARGCVWRGTYGESTILMFISILGRRMPEVYGFAALLGDSTRFWLQSWDAGYVELSMRDVTSQSALEELAVDAARQLGGQLWTEFPEEFRRYQRHAQLRALRSTSAQIAKLSKQLARESNQAWERFRAQPDPPRSRPSRGAPAQVR
ncbi:MAG: DUF2252 family protein [Kofleriaceae bacterium]